MHKKVFIIVNGTMGVGKSAVCEELLRTLQNSVYLEGDWCWTMNPFVVNSGSRRMVEDNIVHVLRNFLSFPSFQYVIFGWVLHLDDIYQRIMGKLQGLDFVLIRVTLMCSEEVLVRRFLKDVSAGFRDESRLEESVRRLKLYEAMNTNKIDTTDISAAEAALCVRRMIVEEVNKRDR